jgi:hypothetical protein
MDNGRSINLKYLVKLKRISNSNEKAIDALEDAHSTENGKFKSFVLHPIA